MHWQIWASLPAKDVVNNKFFLTAGRYFVESRRFLMLVGQPDFCFYTKEADM